jgi:hypothetical protein
MTPPHEKLQNFTIDVIYDVELYPFGLELFAVWRYVQKCCQVRSFLPNSLQNQTMINEMKAKKLQLKMSHFWVGYLSGKCGFSFKIKHA